MLSNKNETHRRHAEAAPLAQVWWQCREGENDGRFHPLGEDEIAELLPKKHNGDKQKYRSTNDNCYMKNVSETPGGRLADIYAGRFQPFYPLIYQFGREGTPFVYLLWANGTPFSHT